MKFVHIILLVIINLLMVSCASQKSLHKAVIEHDSVKVKELIYKDINPYKTNTKGQSAISIALDQVNNDESNLFSWARNLLNKSRNESSNLLYKIKFDKITVSQFERILQSNTFYIDITDLKYEKTLLFSLVDESIPIEYINKLLEAGANPNIATIYGWTPLISAIYYANIPAAKALIAAGADVNLTNENGWAALHFTANSLGNGTPTQNLQLAKILLKAGADINARKNNYGTPLILSVLNNQYELQKLLLSKKANPDIGNADGWTPLISAIYHGNIPVVKALISAGANVDAANNQGWTSLHMISNSLESGIRSNDIELAKILLQAGANINIRQEIGETPLAFTVIYKRQKIQQLLIKANANLDTANMNGITPLMQAVFHGNTQAAKDLIAAGANLDITDKNGWTPLHITANEKESGTRNQDQELALILIEAGANLNAKNNFGLTPLDLALINQRDEVKAVLLAKGER